MCTLQCAISQYKQESANVETLYIFAFEVFGKQQFTYAIGDILYASNTTTLAKLNIGSSGNVLTVNNNNPSWTSNINIYSGGTGLSSFSKGDMLYYDSGSTFTKLSAGGANKVLKMKGDGSVPEWGSVIDTVSNLASLLITFISTGRLKQRIGRLDNLTFTRC